MEREFALFRVTQYHVEYGDVIVQSSPWRRSEGRGDPVGAAATQKGGSWHLGMKLHVGTDRRGIVHSVTVDR